MRIQKLSCEKRVALLCDYLDGALPGSRRRLIREHRRSCRPCSRLLAGLEKTVRVLKALKRAKAPLSARRAVAAALLR